MATRYFIESYPPDGSHMEPDFKSHASLEDALADARERLGRPVCMPPDWMPEDPQMAVEIPGVLPVGAWHESDDELCGGVAVWSLEVT